MKFTCILVLFYLSCSCYVVQSVQRIQDFQNVGGSRPNHFLNFKTTSELFTSSHSFKRNFDGSLITEAPAPVVFVGAPAPAPVELAGAPASAPAPEVVLVGVGAPAPAPEVVLVGVGAPAPAPALVLSGEFASAPAPAPVGSGLIQFNAGKNNRSFDKKKNQKSELKQKSELSMEFDKNRNGRSSLIFRRNSTTDTQITKHNKQQSRDGWCRTTMGDEGVYGCWELAQSVGMAGADHLQIVNQANSMPCATSFPKSDDIMVYPCMEVSVTNEKNGKDYDTKRLEEDDELDEESLAVAGVSEKTSTQSKHHFHKHHGHHSNLSKKHH